jgi:F-box and leucine-rich repeat protein 9
MEANSIFRTWDVRGTYHERVHVFDNCYHISLAKNAFLNRKIFDFFVSKAPNLREIDLSFSMGKLKPAERNQLLDHFIFYLKGYGASIKSINLRQTLTDDFFLNQLSEVKCLKLKSLAITFNGSTNNRKYGIIPLINAQSGLEEFDLQDSPAVEETVMIEICKVMKNMRKLWLRRCTHVTDYCLREIAKLEFLEVLDITRCELVTDEGIFEALITGHPKKNLKELYFGLLSQISENLFARLGSKLHNQLTVLDLGGSTNLADDALQTIFCHYPFIRYLNLDSCCKISDYGMTGKFQNQFYYSIKGLKGLRILRLQNVYKVTDFALIDSFEFLELKELYLARTHFTREGIESLVKKCPAIEVLDLGEVEGVDDDVVEIIVKNLTRLQTLKLNGKLNVKALISI